MSGVCSNRFLDPLASPIILLTVCRAITFFEIPLHIYGAYCIIQKTPKQMARVKKSMLIMHFATVFLNFSLTFLTIPFVMLPAMAGIPLGILTPLTGFPLEYQVYSVVTGMGLNAMSTLAVYENRYALLNDNKRWNKYRKAYIIVNYILVLSCFVYPVYQVPEQARAQQYLLEQYPCILEKTGLDLDSVFFMSYEAVKVAGPMIIEATICFSQLFVFAILTYKFFWKKRSGVSSKTFEMQRKFIIALFVQTSMVLIILIIPLYLFMLSAFSNRYDQGLNNLCIIIFSMNATISTTAMIFLHPPYRQFTIHIFTRRFLKCYESHSLLNSGI